MLFVLLLFITLFVCHGETYIRPIKLLPMHCSKLQFHYCRTSNNLADTLAKLTLSFCCNFSSDNLDCMPASLLAIYASEIDGNLQSV